MTDVQRVDPTKNVIELVYATSKRQDDLREMQTIHNREIMELRQAHISELMTAEHARIDALRQVDVQATAFANEQARQQALLLAEQTKQSFAIVNDQIADLQKAQFTMAGNTGGKKDLWILLMGAILFLITIAGFILDIISHG